VWNWEGCEEAEVQDAGSLDVGKVYLYSPGVFLVVEWRVVEAACMSLVRGRLFLLPRSILSGRLRAVGICE
jgi:hypothetical protein